MRLPPGKVLKLEIEAKYALGVGSGKKMKMLIFNGLRSCPHPLRSTDSKMTKIIAEGHLLVLPLDRHFVFKNTKDFRDL